MLKVLRKKGVAKKIIWVIAVLIIISFGFLGTAYLITGQQQTTYAGEIFGKKISIEDYNKVYQNTRIQAVRQYGYNLEKIAGLLDLDAQTWDRLIILNESKKQRVRVSDDQVVEAVREDKSFEKNNQFDVLLYNAILRNLRIRPRDYEENVRDNLRIAELYKKATSSVKVTEEEILKEYQTRNEKVQISYVFVDPELFKSEIAADASLIQQYYHDHKSEFLTPPTVDVRYITFDFPEPQEPPAETSEKDTSPREDQEAELEKQKDLVREKAATVFQELLVNPDMTAIAQKYNLTVQTSGFFSMEQPDLTLGWSYDLLNKIFQMAEGEVNEPFETPHGLSIVQVKEKRDSYIPEFAEAQEKARAAVVRQEARTIAGQKTAGYRKAIAEELDKSKLRDFPKAAKTLELEIHQTPIFNRGQYLPQIGISKEFQEAAFQLTENNNISEVVEVEKGYCILHLDQYVPVDKSEYEKAKAELSETIFTEKQEMIFKDYLAELRQRAGLIDNIPQLRGRAQ